MQALNNAFAEVAPLLLLAAGSFGCYVLGDIIRIFMVVRYGALDRRELVAEMDRLPRTFAVFSMCVFGFVQFASIIWR